MGRKDVAAVVPESVHLGNDVETLVVFQELVVHFHLDILYVVDSLGSDPNNGLIHHIVAISLEKLDGSIPGINETSIGTFTSLLQTGESISMTISEPKFTCHQAVGVFRFGQVGKHTLSIEVQGIHMVDGKRAMHPRRIFPHGEIDAGT